MDHPASPILRPEPLPAAGFALPRAAGAVLRLIRAENCVMAGLATLVGAGTASAATPPRSAGTLIGSAAAVVLVLAFGNVVNDVVDHEADRLGKAHRPLPSGRISAAQASYLAAALVVGAVGVTLVTPHRQLGLVLAMCAVAAAYSPFLKRVPLVGNITVAGQCGAALVFGARAAGEVSGTTIGAAVLVGVGILCVEVAKTVEDHHADGRAGTRTVAHLVGPAHHTTLVGAAAASYLVVWALLWTTAGSPLLFSLAAAPILPLVAFAVLPPGGAPSSARVRPFIVASKCLWPLALVALTGL